MLKTRQFIRAAEAEVKSYETNLDIAKKRLEGGTLLKSGVLDIEVRLAQAREELVRARNANALAVRALRNLLGIEEGEFEVADTRAFDPGARLGRFLRAPGTGRRRATASGPPSTRCAPPKAVTSRASTLSAAWTMITAGITSTAAAASPPARLLQWDLWDGKLTRAKVAEAKANLESAREEQRKLRLALDLEVEQARLDLNAANERLAVTEQAVAQAAESESLTRARFGRTWRCPRI